MSSVYISLSSYLESAGL